jgi:hypothetical protein
VPGVCPALLRFASGTSFSSGFNLRYVSQDVPERRGSPLHAIYYLASVVMVQAAR